MRRLPGVGLLLSLLLVPLSVSAQRLPVPPLNQQRIHDQAALLTVDQVAQLNGRLQQYEDSTSNQIALLIVPTLGGEAIEEYSYRVATAWQLGQKDRNNGVLIVVAVNDRQMRIEIGKGLEGAMTDAQAGRIIRNEMAPLFRQGRYYEGLDHAIVAIAQAIGGEYDALSSPVKHEEKGTRFTLALILLFLLGSFVNAMLYVKGIFGWIGYIVLIPFVYLIPPLFLPGLLSTGIFGIYLIGAPILRWALHNTAWGKRRIENMQRRANSSRGGSSGRWYGGGWSGGGGWSSGGGFSGGGGSFGGGGSSGRW